LYLVKASVTFQTKPELSFHKNVISVTLVLLLFIIDIVVTGVVVVVVVVVVQPTLCWSPSVMPRL